jgi:lysophospholipase L1-like esterase
MKRYILLFIAALTMPLLAAEPPRVSGVSTVTPVTQDRDHVIYSWQKRHEEVLARNKIFKPDVVIFGDSIIHYWGGEPVAPIARGARAWTNSFAGLKVTNLGFGWDRTENVLWRIDHGELSGIKPKVIVIKIGTNNTAVHDRAEDIAAGIMAVCAAAHKQQPNAKILLLALLPRPDEKTPRPTATEKVNALLPALSAKIPWLTYCDFGEAFRNADGTVSEKLFCDGVHPNAAGYDILERKIREQLNILRDENEH